MNHLPKHKQLILFDGVCNLCSNTFQFVIKHDKKNQFMFAPLQGKAGQEIINKYNIDTAKTDSILLYSEEKGLKLKSTAALYISKDLGFPYALLSVFLIVAAFIRNMVYDFIAKNRYKCYGKKEACMIPTPDLKSKFLE